MLRGNLLTALRLLTNGATYIREVNMEIAIVNSSSMVKDADVKVMVDAIQIQLTKHVLPAWNMQEATIKFYADVKTIPNQAWVIYVIDNDPQVEGALGFHEEVSDQVVGYIMCQPILSNGGTVLAFDAKNPGAYTVSGTLSHEVIEAIGDPDTNSYYDDGAMSWCGELCDTVEQIGYGIKVGGVEVAVSDFVLPSFFNPSGVLSKDGPFNYLGSVKRPFTILDGGYAIIRKGGPGTEKQVFGRLMPDWRKATKTKVMSRAHQRVQMAKKNHPSIWMRVWVWVRKLVK